LGEQESSLQEYGVVNFLFGEEIPAAINIFIIEVLPSMVLYEMTNNLIEESEDYRHISNTNTTIGGMQAVERIYYQYEFGTTAKAKEALILNNDTLDLIMIRYLTEPENFEENLPAFDHMLQSFKVGVNP
jgi:hypothetical protein